MKRLLWVIAASFMVLVRASAQDVVHYFTWYDSADEEKGVVRVGEYAHLVVPDYGANLPEGYVVSTWWWSSTPGACDVEILTYYSYEAWFYPPDEGEYEICMKMYPHTGDQPLWDKQIVTVLNGPPSVRSPNVAPIPAVAGSDLQFVTADATDEDGVASCEVDFGDGNGYVDGTIAPSDWDEDTFVCTGPAYAYEAGGTYEITVRATDTLGLAGTSIPTSVIVFPRPYVFVDKIFIDSTLARSRRLYDYTGTVELVGVGSTASLAKAQVSAEWRDAETGRVLFRQSTTANASGVAKFVMRSVAHYWYDLCVTSVKKSGFDYYTEENPRCAYGGGPE